jgi:lipopolysaccharide transport system permease protein
MGAHFGSPRILLRAPGHVNAAFDLENTSEQAWGAGDGYAVGYQVFDPGTQTLVIDGERTPPARDVLPGASQHFDLELQLPPEPGRYRIFISLMREHVAWFYERGWELLLIDAAVNDEGQGRIERTRVTNLASLKREWFWRAIGRAFTLPVQSIWRNRSLIRSMVRRDILGRYRGSFGGMFWTVLSPLLLMVTYFFVFGVVLQARFENDPSRSGFALYFLAGMLPWLAFSEALGRAPFVMLEHRTFIKKLLFPVETLPVNMVIAGLVSELFGLALFTIGFFLVRGLVPPTVLLLPLLLVPQVLFTAGLCWFLAALGVFVRDLGQVNGFILTLWFFLTPICYPESKIAGIAPILTKNPMFILVRGYREVFLEGRAPDWGPLAALWVVAIAVFLLGHAWFYKLRKSFADMM